MTKQQCYHCTGRHEALAFGVSGLFLGFRFQICAYISAQKKRVYEPLRYLLNSLVCFEETELDRILPCFKHRVFEKKSLLLAEHQVCRTFYYVQKGCLRTYFITRERHEKTRYVITDCGIGTALASFIGQTPSFELMDAVEDTEALCISHDDFYRLNREVPRWKAFYQKILEMAYCFQTQSFENLVTLTAQERFAYVLNHQPLLVQRLSNKMLASYLDMTQETLSRLKSKRRF